MNNSACMLDLSLVILDGGKQNLVEEVERSSLSYYVFHLQTSPTKGSVHVKMGLSPCRIASYGRQILEVQRYKYNGNDMSVM